MADKAKILAVGIATVDIVHTVEQYPHEDDEVRAGAQHIRRGGNASNTLVVLSMLGHHCSWAGTLADDIYADLIRTDLRNYGVNIDHVIVQPHSASPLSCITLSEDSGKRSIVHFRDLAELSFTDFLCVDVGAYDWLHFEGRNVEQTVQMLRHLRKQTPSIPVSIEIEKPRSGIEELMGFADVLLYSKVYAQHAGYRDAAEFLHAMHERYPTIEQYCAWGAAGAFAIDAHGKLYHAAALAGISVIDSVGAGDVFNAGVIHARLGQLALQDALDQACTLAGRKCAQYGFEGLMG